jgi:hypothetical protein
MSQDHPDSPQDATTPGPADLPEPEAPAWVAELLSTLRSDDPPIPEYVAARLDTAIAAEAAARPRAATPAAPGAPGSTTEDQPGVPAEVTTLDRARRRSSPPTGSRTGHRVLLGAVAAAAVVVLAGLGAIAVNRSGSSSGPTPVTAIASPSQVATAYVASEHNTTAATLASDARTLLAQTGNTLTSASPAVVASPGTVVGQVTASPTYSVGPAAEDVRPSVGCLTQLTGSAVVKVLVADAANYDGAPAYIVLAPTLDSATQAVDPTTVDIWVVRRTCSATDAAVITFLRTTR